MRRRAFGLLAASLAVAGCTPGATGFLPPGSVAQGGAVPNPAPLTGTRVGLLLPLTGANAGAGQALLQAVRLALGAPGPGAPQIALDQQDTAGTPSGAAIAARQAVAAGDQLIIGPLTGPETAAAAPAAVAASVPILSFTNDPAQAQPGVWVLGITPAQQVRRLVVAAQDDGRSKFAAVLPDNAFGQAMGEALSRAVPDADVRSYATGAGGAAGGLAASLADISDYAGRHAGGTPAATVPAIPAAVPKPPPPAPKPAPPPRASFRGLQASGDVTPGGTNVAPRPAIPVGPGAQNAVPPPAPSAPAPAAIVPPPPASVPAATPAAPVPPPPFDALLVAELGAQAQALGPLLARDDIVAPKVRVLGPAPWQVMADRLGGLAGAWYAAPDPAARADFVARYTAMYHGAPPPIADLAYDAGSLARVMVQGGGISTAALTRPQGFAGADGVLALQPDGTVRRGLAVFEIGHGAPRIVSPAPTNLGAPGV